MPSHSSFPFPPSTYTLQGQMTPIWLCVSTRVRNPHSCVQAAQRTNVSRAVIIIYHRQEAGRIVESVPHVVREQNPISQLNPSFVIDARRSVADMLEMLPVSLWSCQHCTGFTVRDHTLISYVLVKSRNHKYAFVHSWTNTHQTCVFVHFFKSDRA